MPNFSLFRTLPRDLAAVFMLASMGCGHAWAQSSDATPSTASSTQWGLGLAATVSQSPRQGVDDKPSVLPLLYVENDWLRVLGTGAELKAGTWELGPGDLSLKGRLEYDGDGYKASDARELRGMAERKDSFWAGASVAWRVGSVTASMEWLADVSDESNGQHLRLQLDHRFALGRFMVKPRVRMDRFDAKYVDYYYGVEAREARANRPAYEGKAGLSTSVGLRLDYPLDARQVLFLDASTTRWPDEITDSPLVDRETTSKLGIGYLFRF